MIKRRIRSRTIVVVVVVELWSFMDTWDCDSRLMLMRMMLLLLWGRTRCLPEQIPCASQTKSGGDGGYQQRCPSLYHCLCVPVCVCVCAYRSVMNRIKVRIIMVAFVLVVCCWWCCHNRMHQSTVMGQGSDVGQKRVAETGSQTSPEKSEKCGFTPSDRRTNQTCWHIQNTQRQTNGQNYFYYECVVTGLWESKRMNGPWRTRITPKRGKQKDNDDDDDDDDKTMQFMCCHKRCLLPCWMFNDGSIDHRVLLFVTVSCGWMTVFESCLSWTTQPSASTRPSNQ